MPKSSAVLRLAAEYASEFEIMAVAKARHGIYMDLSKYLSVVGYHFVETTEHAVMALCLADAIAESEGN
jgi:hypothetical protein